MRLGRNTAPMRLITPSVCRRCKRFKYSGFVDSQLAGNIGIGFRCQWHALLKIIEQSLLESGKISHNPIRCARALKKMPLGFCAVMVAVRSKLLVL